MLVGFRLSVDAEASLMIPATEGFLLDRSELLKLLLGGDPDVVVLPNLGYRRAS
jgi:hypothetical protein